MTRLFAISDVRLVSAGPQGAIGGLLGYVALTINGVLRVDGLTLRRTLSDRLALSFPAKRDGGGRPRPYLRPLNDAARREIEGQVFAALGLVEEAAP